MTQTVAIKIKETQGNEQSVKTVNFEIDSITLKQFTSLLAHVKDLLVHLKDEGSLMDLFNDLLSSDEAQKWLSGDKNPEDITTNQVTDIMAASESNFIVTLVNSFESIAIQLPDQAINILATLSGIPKATLEEQQLEKVLEILDAVVEVNDLNRLFERLKKSLGATVQKYKFLQKRREATAQ